MYVDFISTSMVIIIGLMAGTAIGLFIGYILHKQRPSWADMNAKERLTNLILVAICSLICIGGLAWVYIVKAVP